MYVMTGQRARVAYRGRRTLGDAASLWTGITQNSLNPFVFLPEDWNYLTNLNLTSPVPESPFLNAGYGALTPDQLSTIKQQAAQQITQAAGGNTALAQQQIALANANIDSIVNLNGGVTPGGLANNVTPFGIPSWMLWAAGGVAALLLLTR